MGAVLGIVATAVIWFFALYAPARRREAVDGWRRELSLVADVRSAGLDRRIRDGFDDVRFCASLPEVVALAEPNAATGPDAHSGAAGRAFANFQREHRSRSISILDSNGGVRASGIGPAPGIAALALAESVVRSASPRAELVREADGSTSLAYAVPVSSESVAGPHVVRGAVVVARDAAADLFDLLDQPIAARSSECVLVQADGKDLLLLSPARIQTRGAAWLRRPAATTNLAARAALLGGNGFAAFVDYSDVPVYAAVRRLKEAPWGLVVKVDVAEALADVRKEILHRGISWGALLVAMSAAVVGLWHWGMVGEIRRLNAELEERVRQRTAELEAANKELEAFSYSVSHDLRAPLRAVDGFSRILLEDYAERLDAEGRRLIDVVRSNTRRMGRLIDDLLAFSRAGRQGLTRTAVDMASLATAAFEEVRPAGEDVSFSVGSLPAAEGDPNLLKQVWMNLLSNAVKFTRPKAERRIRVEGGAEPDRVVYRVKDSGVGFDMTYSNKLFDVFQRLHSGSEFEGTGVGLALVKRIVLRHGGEVWAEGNVGEGAVFSFSLPRPGGSR